MRSETWVAFLRGVNLGKRQVKNAELRAAYEAMGLDNVRTLIASGNVIFDAEDTPTREALEAGFAARFGFESGTVLRRQSELRDLIASDPFEGREEDENTKLYVTFLAEPVGKSLPMPMEVPGDFRVVKCTEREICILAFRLPTGRFGLGMEAIWKHFDKKSLWTSRNWNTVIKAAK
jgi:uncharacterized protein (DUF1697 family)